MTPNEFKKLQKKLGLTNKEIGELLYRTEDAIDSWRIGRNPIEKNAAQRLRDKVKEIT